jgi:hypothetical protein
MPRNPKTYRIYPHGDDRRYRLNRCRCTECRAAHTAEANRRRRAIAYGRWAGLIDATGTTRRVQALATAGWSFAEIAARRGIHRSCPRDIAYGVFKQIHATVARSYADLYDDLCNEDGPSTRIQLVARRNGWAGPEAWTDETIDDPHAQPLVADDRPDEEEVRRAVAGHTRYRALREPDRAEVYRRMAAAGHGPGTIQARLRINKATLQQLATLAAGVNIREAA